MLNRSIKKIYPVDGNVKNNEGLTFADILEIPNIVLLGEPGAGKSHLFTHASDQENGNCISARTFTLHADDTYTNKPVYIDALDEKRSRSEQPDSIGEIIRCIKQIKPSKVRLSCRVADWLGETDLELFKPYFEANGGYCVVVLEALTEEEIDRILSGENIDNPREFREQAYSKGVSSLLTNPQTLIMLADSVKNGQWPKTKKELYKNATELLLTEHNDKHKRKPLAGFTSSQLKDAAGAACAVLLIADVEGISLLKSCQSSYAEIPYPDSEAVLAALTKQAFVTTDQEQVNYSHRTIAEYLAACWLISSIRKGLPVSRVCSWLCVDSYPAPELRGLYAWLVQLLPEHADALMAGDPYGVLVLGDVSCLSLSSRKALLNALVKLAEKDPWFRAQDWTSEPLGALSTPDMANEFKAILSKQPQQFHLRSVVLNAIQFGEQQPELKDDLLEIFCDNDAYYAERSNAFEGLINTIPDGIALVVNATKERLHTSTDDLRLKEEVMVRIYDGNFNVDDVIQLVSDHINHREIQDRLITGGLWRLSRSLPLDDLPEILDRLTLIKLDESKDNDDVWHFIHETLKRTLLSTENIDVGRLWLWLSKLKFSPRYSSYRNKDSIKDWLGANQQHVMTLFNIALHEQNDLASIWGFWNDFQQWVRFEFDMDQIINSAFSLIAEKVYCNEKEQFIFELALSLTLTRTTNLERFNSLFNYGESHPELADVLARSCLSEVQNWRWKDINRKIEYKKNQQNTQQKNRSNFEQELGLIRTGQHLGWSAWLADVYFARFTDVERTLEPKKRLEQQLGEQNVDIALEVLQAVLNRNDLPTPLEIANSYSQNQYQRWWYSILAGMSECWCKQGDLTAYSEQVLKAALALNLLFPSFYRTDGNSQTQIEPDWQQALFLHKPELVQAVYMEVVETLLKTKRDYVQGIRDLCQHPQLTHNRAATVLRLLTSYPNAPSQELETLLLTAITLPEIKEELLFLIQSVLKPYTRVRLNQKMLWLSVGFLIDFDQFKDAVIHCAAKRESFIWTLISIIDHARSDNDKNQPCNLSIAQLDFVMRLAGKRFPDAEHTTVHWSGVQNPRNASEFVRRRITQLSTQIDEESISVLNHLIHEPELNSYCDYLKHAAANQAALRRKQLFVQPNWQQVIDALSNGKPAHIADLHALTIEHLKDIGVKIRSENTDIFKSFWNEDSYGRINDPKPEESCRDRLIDLLKPKFVPLDINIEPEGHMVIDKRADIILLNATKQKLPIEVKQNYHKNLWTACENQLDRLYTRDPQAQGYGIYLVFWFGDKRPRSMPKPPNSLPKPNTAQELENALRSLIKADNQNRLAVVVIDVTRPEE
ncbi:MAG: hypothetical protein PHC94_08745 [Methylobacter sp.]|nr:hypothetical protein [Methylobacter sp.]